MSFGVLACPGCGTPINTGVDMPRMSVVNRVQCRVCGMRPLMEELIRVRSYDVLGGPGPSQTTTTPAMTYNPIFNASGTNAGPLVTLGTFSLSPNSTLMVSLAYYFAFAPIDGLSWGGTQLTNATSSTIGISGVIDQWTLFTATGGTNLPLVMDCTSMSSVDQYAATFSEIKNCLAGADKTAMAVGTGIVADSGNTAATLSAREVFCGVVGAVDTSVAGTWSDSFVAANSATVTNHETWAIQDGTLIASAIGTPRARLTFNTSESWSASITTIR